MGAQLQMLFDKVMRQLQNDPKRLGSVKIKLVMKLGEPSDRFISLPDTPEILDKFKKAVQELGESL
jgi:hypothetical protein